MELRGSATEGRAAAPLHGWLRAAAIFWFFFSVAVSVMWWKVAARRVPWLRERAATRRKARFRSLARRYRLLALRLGGILIKFGQFLSSRIDIFPEEVTTELESLRDAVPALSLERIRPVLEAVLGEAMESFDLADEEAVAAASLAQVHRAVLEIEPGVSKRVVLKIQRPGIRRVVEADLVSLTRVARAFMLLAAVRRHVDLPRVFEEFGEMVRQELDFRIEERNLLRFAEQHAGDSRLRVPEVHAAYTTRRLLVMEDVRAIEILDVSTLAAAGIDPQMVARCLVEIYADQIFRTCFVHADPHPGNLFVEPLAECPVEPLPDGSTAPNRDFAIVFVDFGMMLPLSLEQSEALQQLIEALIFRHTEQAAVALETLQVFSPTGDREVVREALRQIWRRNPLPDSREAAKREKKQARGELQAVLSDNPIQLPALAIYLGRIFGVLSGVCAHLGIEPMDAVKVIASRAMSPVERLRRFLIRLKTWLRTLADRPEQLRREAAERARLAGEIVRLGRRVSALETRIFLVGAVIVAAVYDVGVDGEPSWVLAGGVLLALSIEILRRTSRNRWPPWRIRRRRPTRP